MPSTNRPVWLLARRPLLLALVLGFAISLIVSGRFTVRLIADGALSFAFVPLAELGGLALVYYLGRRVLPFAQAVDRFFSRNTAWLWWLMAIMTLTVVLPVMQHERLMAPLLLSLLIPIVLSVRHDLLYFRDVPGATRAARGSVIQRSTRSRGSSKGSRSGRQQRRSDLLTFTASGGWACAGRSSSHATRVPRRSSRRFAPVARSSTDAMARHTATRN